MKVIVFWMTAVAVLVASPSRAADPSPLVVEAKILLGDVNGRIDHFAVDLKRKRIFVAELGNDSVGVIDLDGRKMIRRINGLREPQGVGYVASTDTLYVANARDGSVQLFQGDDLAPAGRIDLGDDADNIRVDADANKVFIGYGSGALAVIDPVSRTKIADIPLKAHPEGFQLENGTGRIFVNLPDARQIAVADRSTGKVSASMPLKTARANFPMAIDRENGNLLVVARAPPKLLVFGLRDLSLRASIDTCGDADDVFVDPKRHRVYVSCGEGFIDVFERREASYEKVARLPTVSGARTALFVPEIDKFFLAVRAAGKEPATIWVFRPEP